MEWKNKQVLVTGAGGFIGSHLVEQLASRGAHIRAFAHYNSRGDPGRLRLLSASALAQVELIAGDLRDAQAVREAVQGSAIVFHLGALISIPYSYRHPAEVAETNFMGTLNMLLACREFGVERLVHTSTSEVYGTGQYTPMDEAHPLHAQSPYSASKIGADKLAESFYCTYELPVVTVRPFNTYGPRQSGRAVIPAIIAQALAGARLRIGSLETQRDFTFVDDTVCGFLRAAEAVGVEGGTFNLGTRQAITIGELAQRILRLMKRDLAIEVDLERLRPQRSEVMNLLSDNRLACETLGWQPRTSLEAGLGRTIDWIREHAELYRPGTYEF
jgi:NAD dependent epimerase/dehydratase